MTRDIENHCRIVLVAPDEADPAALATKIGEALRGGDVATVILPRYDRADHELQAQAEALTPVVQGAGAAFLIADDSRVAGRTRADGVHVTGGIAEMAEATERLMPKMIVGGGNAKERHKALEMGELRPDYMFFGKLDGDIKPEPHPKNLALGEWWASMVEIPCVVMCGTDIEGIAAVAETGAEFVALRLAVFGDGINPAQAVAEANAILDERAPRLAGA